MASGLDNCNFLFFLNNNNLTKNYIKNQVDNILLYQENQANNDLN